MFFYNSFYTEKNILLFVSLTKKVRFTENSCGEKVFHVYFLHGKSMPKINILHFKKQKSRFRFREHTASVSFCVKTRSVLFLFFQSKKRWMENCVIYVKDGKRISLQLLRGYWEEKASSFMLKGWLWMRNVVLVYRRRNYIFQFPRRLQSRLSQ